MKVNTKEKPCLTCTKVKDPANCEIKRGPVWQIWFLRKWDEVRKAVQKNGT